MGLANVTDAFASYLRSTLSPVPTLVGSRYPAAAADLPAVVLSLSGVAQAQRGVGRLPAPSETGALAVTTSVDLTNPVVTFPDAIVNLLSPDRMTLSLPHGPLVAADGTTTTLAAGDVQVTIGATTMEVVDSAPAAGQVEPDPNLGVLHFGAPLPAPGTLEANYFIGQWEVKTERYQGSLLVELFAGDAPGVDVLSRAVETALLAPSGAPLAGLERIDPVSWAGIEPASAVAPQASSRAATFAFDYELIQPDIGGGGGVISTVSVSSTVSADTPVVEQFDVQQQGSSA